MKQAGDISQTLKQKARILQKTFPELFGHIDLNDIVFCRTEAPTNLLTGIVLILNNQEPWSFLVNELYVMMAYPKFDLFDNDKQFSWMAHYMLMIPKGYKEKPDLRLPDVIAFQEERLIWNWLNDHSFEQT